MVSKNKGNESPSSTKSDSSRDSLSEFTRTWRASNITSHLKGEADFPEWRRQVSTLLLTHNVDIADLKTHSESKLGWNEAISGESSRSKTTAILSPNHDTILWMVLTATVREAAATSLIAFEDADMRGTKAYCALCRRFDPISRARRDALERHWRDIKISQYSDLEAMLADVHAIRAQLHRQGVRKSDDEHTLVLRLAVANDPVYERHLTAATVSLERKNAMDTLYGVEEILRSAKSEHLARKLHKRIGAAEANAADASENEPEVNYAAGTDARNTPGRDSSNWYNQSPEGWKVVQTDRYTPQRRGRPGRRIELFEKPDGTFLRTMRCTVCSGYGHWATECASVKHDRTGSPRNARRTDRTRSPEQAEANIAEGTNGTVWAVDTCASHDICGRDTPLTNSRFTDTAIRGVGGKSTVARESGDFTDGHLHLSNVLRVPTQRRNLMSVPRRCADGEAFVFSKSGAWALRPRGNSPVTPTVTSTGDVNIDRCCIIPLHQTPAGFWEMIPSATAHLADATHASPDATHTHQSSTLDAPQQDHHSDDSEGNDVAEQANETRRTEDITTPRTHTIPGTLREDELWHLRSAHLTTLDSVHGHPLSNDVTCEACHTWKTSRRTHAGQLDNMPGTYYCDIWTAGMTSLHGERYALTVVHPATGYVRAFFLRTRDQAAKYIRILRDESTQTKWPLRKLCCDGETSVALGTRLAGIRLDATPRDTPELNGYSERAHQTLGRAAHAMLDYAKLPHAYWALAFSLHR